MWSKALSITMAAAILTASPASAALRQLLDTNVASCEVSATATNSQNSLNAFANAVADATANACNEGNFIPVEAAARTLVEADAEAFAQAVATAGVDCETVGNGSIACAEITVGADSSSSALATGIARAAASGLSTCSCDDDQAAEDSVSTERIQEIMVRAVSDVLVDVCSTDNDTVDIDVTLECTAKQLLTGLSEAIANAVVDGGCGNSNPDHDGNDGSTSENASAQATVDFMETMSQLGCEEGMQCMREGVQCFGSTEAEVSEVPASY